MWYWNGDNFTGLKRLADALRQDPKSVLMADYCELRAGGRRKEAFQKLHAFLEEYAACPVADRRMWANGLMELQQAYPLVHQLLPFPLREALISVFENWAHEEETAAQPCRWLGELKHSQNWFEMALERDPADEYSRLQLADYLIAGAEYNCEHLPDTFFGDVAETIGFLDAAESLLKPVTHSQSVDFRMGDIQTYRAAIHEWVRVHTSQKVGAHLLRAESWKQ